MSYDGATIEVLNWDKYNPRGDSKKPSWFRLENNLATGPAFFGLDCEQKWLWIVILSLVSQKNGESITWNSGYIHATTGIKPKKQDETLEIFEKFVRLRVSREVTLRVSPATYERTNEHNERDGTDERTTRVSRTLPPLAEIWNNHRGQLPEVKGCTGKRLTSAKERWDEKPSTEYWTEIVDRIKRSEFCNGKNDRGWKADFDFLIRPDTQHKVSEGKYDNRTQSQGGYVDPLVLELRRQLEEEMKNGSAF